MPNKDNHIYDKQTRIWFDVTPEQFQEYDRWRTRIRKREQAHLYEFPVLPGLNEPGVVVDLSLIKIRIDTGGRLHAQFHPQFDVDQEIALVQPPVAEPAKAAFTGNDMLGLDGDANDLRELAVHQSLVQLLDDVILVVLHYKTAEVPFIDYLNTVLRMDQSLEKEGK